MFSVVASNVDESLRPNETPAKYVTRLAETKARAAFLKARTENIIIGADTVVVDDSAILGKPADVAEAVAMLKRLRGHSHQVYTGIAALRVRDGKLVTDLCVTDVPMRAYSDDEIEAYVLSGDPFDKAGAYAIQHPRFHPVERLAGCYASVMGLPLCHLMRTVKQLDLQPSAEIPARCQAFLNYVCPISDAVLRGEQIG